MKNFYFILALSLFCAFPFLKAQKKNLKKENETDQTVTSTRLDLNNISTPFQNNGISDENSGFIYPNGSGKTAIYQSGLVFGTSISGVKEAGGSTYNSGLQPGWFMNFYSVCFIDSNTGWAVGSSGEILKTTNGGTNWFKESGQTNNDLQSIYFVSSNTGWIVGNNGIILKTTDAGSSWQTQNSTTSNDLYSVQFVDQNDGWAVGAGGIILHTSNGSDWSAQTDPGNSNLNSVFFVNKDSGWAVGANGTILNSVDGGMNWSSVASPTIYNLHSVNFAKANKGWIAGDAGIIVNTTNGSTWNANQSGSDNINSIYFINSDSGWATGGNGTILSTTDGGVHWETQTSNTINYLNSVQFTDSQNGWVAGSMGVILKTTDGGTTWINQIPERIFRVRPDVYPGGPQVDLSVEAANEGLSQSQIRTQYEADWNQWPAYMGAPFVDNNHDGIYEPDTDTPGIKNAAQTIWFISNDQNSSLTTSLYGSAPIGIEYQGTIWTYKDSLGFDNLIFRKYKLINKSDLTNNPLTFDSMYVAMWSDLDIGNASDDFAGCDTLLNLGYAYNSTDVDANYTPLPPPAVGFRLIRGPFVQGKAGEDLNRNGIDDQNDYGYNANNAKVQGYINLPMTAFYYNSQMFPSPSIGTYGGTIQTYNYLQGKDESGNYFTNPVSNSPTTFALSGDPVAGTGWVDGISESAGDRQIGVSTGPFQMAPGDTQVVVYAQIAAGAQTGTSRLMAIDTLRSYSNIAEQFYNGNNVTAIEENNLSSLPANYRLYQNYPNPFNPSTKISFSIPEESRVRIDIYNVLGQQVRTLLNENKNAGNYTINFNAENLASGIYLYRIRAGNYIKTKKMILLK